MSMTPGIRKLALTAHITTSVGWLGAVAAFLVLSIAGLTSGHAEKVRAAYLAMNLIGEFIIVPLSLAALLTGIVQSLGTHWGLFRYYWVLAKLALTSGATLLLLLHQFTAVAEAARLAAQTPMDQLPDIGRLGSQLAFEAAAGVLVLLAITILAIYKPWGKTPFGFRQDSSASAGVSGETSRFKIILWAMGFLLTAIVVLHLVKGRIGHHHH